MQGKHREGWRVVDPVNPADRLEDLGSAGVHLRRAVKNGAVLLGRLNVGTWQMMVPARRGRSDVTEPRSSPKDTGVQSDDYLRGLFLSTSRKI